MLTTPDTELTDLTGALSGASCVRFHDLAIVREDGRDPLVGCAKARRFLEVDDTTIAALEAIDSAPSLAAAEAELHDRFGEEFDIVQLVELTRDRGFVATIDGEDVDFDAPDAATRHAWLYRLSPHLAWLRHPVSLCAPVAMFLLVLALLPSHLWLLPRPFDLQVPVRPVLVPLVAFGALMLCAYIHELAHFFVARSYGIDAIIKISRRYHIAVLETDVTNAWTLTARQRLAIFAAGSLFNLFVIASAMLVQLAAYHGLIPLPAAAASWLRLVAYVNFLPLLYQLAFFARTDVYFALLVATGQRNLRTDAMRFIVWKFVRVARVVRRLPHQPCATCHAAIYSDDPYCVHCHATQRVDDPNRYPFTAADRRTLGGFASLLASLPILAVSYLTIVGIDAQTRFFHLLVLTVRHAWQSGNPVLILEAAAFAALYVCQLGLLLVVATRFFGRLLWRAARRVYRWLTGAVPAAAVVIAEIDSPIDQLVTDRRRVLERVAAGKLTMVAASAQLGVSRSHMYELRRRYVRDGESALRPRRTVSAR